MLLDWDQRTVRKVSEISTIRDVQEKGVVSEKSIEHQRKTQVILSKIISLAYILIFWKIPVLFKHLLKQIRVITSEYSKPQYTWIEFYKLSAYNCPDSTNYSLWCQNPLFLGYTSAKVSCVYAATDNFPLRNISSVPGVWCILTCCWIDVY